MAKIITELNYIYDSESNNAEMQDNAHQTIYFINNVINLNWKYACDPPCWLIHTLGRKLRTRSGRQNDFPNNIPNPNTAPGAMQNYIHTYQYDALGNILQMQSFNRWTRDYIYDTATNRLLRHEGSVNVYTYDTHGNMLSMPHLTQMLWDAKDRLIKTSLNPAQGGTADDANTTWYRYDLSGQRVRKVCLKNNITEERIYLNGCEIYRRTNSGVLQTERQTLHIDDDQKKIAFVETLTVADSHPLTTPESLIRYQYDNHLGSACLELDASAAIISYEEYHPFGTTSYRSGRSAAEVSLKRYKYVGKERDEESGLYYYGARYYAAWLCRFVSVDPLQFKYPHYTPYQYAGNKPVSYVDLDGLEEYKSDEFKNESQQSQEYPKPTPLDLRQQKPTVEEFTKKITEIANYLGKTSPNGVLNIDDFFKYIPGKKIILSDGKIETPGNEIKSVHIEMVLNEGEKIGIFNPVIIWPDKMMVTLKEINVVGQGKDRTGNKTIDYGEVDKTQSTLSSIKFVGNLGGFINVTGENKFIGQRPDFKSTSIEGTRTIDFISSRLNEALYKREIISRNRFVKGIPSDSTIPAGYRVPAGRQYKYPLGND
jgi:RHS repeat-associated protein